MADISVEKEPAGPRSGRPDVARWLHQIGRIDHAELDDPVGEAFFRGLARLQIEAPAVKARLEGMLVNIGHHVAVFACFFDGVRHGLVLVIALQNDLIFAFFVLGLPRIRPMQHIGGGGFEPAYVFWLAIARDQRKAGRHALVNAGGVNVALQQLLVPEKRHIVEDRPVLGDRHVMRQARAGQGDRHIMHALAHPVDNPVMHIRRVFGIVEEHQFTGFLIHLGMGGDAINRPPRCLA